jgi:16S rRNA (guanine966-N2)-methyltransferase
MRIISGTLGSRRFNPPNNLPARPTTDVAKTGLFNMLNHAFDFEEVSFLDLFSGTGNISYEFASRGCTDIVAVDNDFGCINFIKKTADEFKITTISTVKSDVYSFLNRNTRTFDIIFADPPYALETIDEMPNLLFEKNILNKGGWFILEHDRHHDFSTHTHFERTRNYGDTIFSIFTNEKNKP